MTKSSITNGKLYHLVTQDMKLLAINTLWL